MLLRFGLLFVTQALLAAAIDYGSLPLVFEQRASGPGFVSRTPQFSFLVTSEGVAFAMGASKVVSMRILGKHAEVSVTAESRLPGQSSYIIGRDSAKWRTAVAHYGRVRVSSALPGVDLVCYGTNRTLEYDLVLHPKAHAPPLVLRFEGGSSPKLNPSGDLEITTATGTLVQHKPRVQQNGRDIKAAYVMRKNGDVQISLAPYDHSRELIIDPIITYSTFLGGAVYDSPNAIAVDSAGNTYIAGSTSSFNFPVTSGAVRTAFPPTVAMVAFVAKLNPAGTALLYATYLGGSGVNGGDAANGIAIDSAGNAYVTGTTGSADFPTTASALSTTLHGPVDAFITKVNATGTALLYSTYFGGSGIETAAGIAIDLAGDAFITGSTGSTDLPVTTGSVQSVLKSANDAFVAKLNPAGAALIYCTYLGGSQEDDASALSLDSAGNAYIVGNTASSDFPITTGSARQSTLTGATAAFAAKLNPTGTILVYSTFLGGSGADYASAVAVDVLGNAYVVGTTYSGDFPVTAGAYTVTVPGAISLGHGFVSKLSGAGANLIYSSYLGGSNADAITGIVLDSSGDAILTGFTYSLNFPVSSNPLDPVGSYSPAGFVSKFNPTGSGLLYSSLLGASGSSAAQSIAIDSTNHAYITGYTAAQNFPTTAGAFQSSNGSISGETSTGFVMKIDLSSSTACSLSVSASSLSVPVLGGSASIAVTEPAGCAWEAIPASAWLSVASTAHGIGPGSVAVTALSNEGSPSARSSIIKVGAISVTVTQPAGTCAVPQLFPATQYFGSAGGTGSVAIQLPSSCTFTASSGVSWISITSAGTSTGDTLLAFTVAADSGVSRTGSLTISGVLYPILQITNVCTYGVAFPSGLIAVTAGGILNAGMTTADYCSWTTLSSASWLLITSPGFVGSGPIFLRALPNNTGASRSATATIAGQQYLIVQ